MENLIKNVKIVSIDRNPSGSEYYIRYTYNIGDGEMMKNTFVSRHEDNPTIGKLLEEIEADAYSKLTLKDAIPFYESKKRIFHFS